MALAGGRRPGFNNAAHLSERQTADRNFALGCSLGGSEAFRPGTDLLQTLEFYLQSCSIELDAELLAAAAASLANAGVRPLTGDSVFTPSTVQSCLSLMSSCGGIEFWRKLVAEYNVHVFDSLVTGRDRTGKPDPRRKKNQSQTEAVVALTWAASQADLNEVRALIATGVEPGTADYDGRTPLHRAAAEGRLEVVRYLLAVGADPEPMDRWGGTPLSDADGNGHAQVAGLLREKVSGPTAATKPELAAV
jgi:glutaminase